MIKRDRNHPWHGKKIKEQAMTDGYKQPVSD
jgi:hypothetical protein